MINPDETLRNLLTELAQAKPNRDKVHAMLTALRKANVHDEVLPKVRELMGGSFTVGAARRAPRHAPQVTAYGPVRPASASEVEDVVRRLGGLHHDVMRLGASFTPEQAERVLASNLRHVKAAKALLDRCQPAQRAKLKEAIARAKEVYNWLRVQWYVNEVKPVLCLVHRRGAQALINHPERHGSAMNPIGRMVKKHVEGKCDAYGCGCSDNLKPFVPQPKGTEPEALIK